MTPLLLGRVSDDRVREAAWVARCVGRAETAPLGDADLSALASYLTRRAAERGRVLFAAGKASQGVWIIRGGMVELVVGAGARRLVVQLLHPGDVDGDVELLLGMPFPYTARAVADTEYLFLEEQAFERLLREEASDGRVQLPQRTLAAMLGVHRPSLNKVLKQFERQRLLEIGYGEIRLLDPQGLARPAGRPPPAPSGPDASPSRRRAGG